MPWSALGTFVGTSSEAGRRRYADVARPTRQARRFRMIDGPRRSCSRAADSGTLWAAAPLRLAVHVRCTKQDRATRRGASPLAKAGVGGAGEGTRTLFAAPEPRTQKP